MEKRVIEAINAEVDCLYDDMVSTLANAAQSFHPGETINVGGSEYRSVADMHELVSAATGVDPQRNIVEFVPEEAHNVRNKRPEITKARELLDHDPSVLLEDGIERTVRWMRDVYGVAA